HLSLHSTFRNTYMLSLTTLFRSRLVFPTLSVRENLLATARQPTQWPAPFTLTKIYELFPRLAERAQHFGGQLSGGEQQMLAIGRSEEHKSELQSSFKHVCVLILE